MKQVCKSYFLFSIFFVLGLLSCSGSKQVASTSKPALPDNYAFILTETTADSSYGYTEKNPIKVGGGLMEGASNERKFLGAIKGPSGEQISYQRLGSCCPFKTNNGIMGSGLLDKYEVKWEGQSNPVILYINMYDYEPLKAPVGFTVR